MKIKKKHKITKFEDCDISRRMRKDKMYYHCCSCGDIYEDCKRNIKILNLNELNGGCFIPSIFRHYKISSTYCDPYYIEALEDLNKRRKNGRQ